MRITTKIYISSCPEIKKDRVMYDPKGYGLLVLKTICYPPPELADTLEATHVHHRQSSDGIGHSVRITAPESDWERVRAYLNKHPVASLATGCF